MKYNLLLAFAFLLIFSHSLIAQNDGQQELSPQIINNINAELEKEVKEYRITLSKKELNADEIEFSIDTFRIERFATKCIEVNSTTVGINEATNNKAISYDKLLNKYYKKLTNKLNPDDKKILIQAQRAWIAFRESETKLIGIMTKDEYSGGGTIQSIIANSSCLELVEKRTIDIFNHFNCIIRKK